MRAAENSPQETLRTPINPAGIFSVKYIKQKAVMIWRYIKTHWFTVAMGCIIVLAVARKSYHSWNGNSSSKIKTEKYTDLAKAPEGKSLFGLLPGGDKSGAAAEVSDETATAFLKRFGPVALGERKKFGMPASVLLACAYVNSRAGQMPFVAEANNYFGLLCTDEWDGATADVSGRCYRKYQTPWESYRDFSIFLTNQDWYGSLRKKAGKDWKAWIEGIPAGDISKSENFKTEAAKVIQAYRLYELDGK